MEYYKIKLHSYIDYLTIDLVVYRESDNGIKTNWTTASIVRFHLENMYKH